MPLFKRKKPSVSNWHCPHCDKRYAKIWVLATKMPYLYCWNSCKRYFTLKGEDVTAELGMLSEVAK